MSLTGAKFTELFRLLLEARHLYIYLKVKIDQLKNIQIDLIAVPYHNKYVFRNRQF